MTETPSRLFTRVDKATIGSMICFFYDAKTKDDLPYWDRFPLIFPIEILEDGFLGINLHYLPLILRAQLMNALYEEQAVRQDNRIVRLNVSYKILKQASMFRGYQPCLKRYLSSHLKSRCFYITPKEWDMALFLPTERFVKATKFKVWKDSREMVS